MLKLTAPLCLEIVHTLLIDPDSEEEEIILTSVP
jgi:hypothetical protein